MAKYLMGFIGVGNMGGTLARAAAKGTDPSGIIVSSRTRDKADSLAKELGCFAGSNVDAALESKYVFLGVKPQVLGGVLAEIAPVIAARRDRFVLVTMAAAVTIARLREMAGGNYPVVRIMPNTPLAVGRGTVLYCSDGADESEIAEISGALRSGGSFDALDERLIDAGSALTGCGPAFAYMFIEALADGAVECGIPRAKALRYAAETVAGSAEMVLGSGKHPGALKDAVCSPGGSTIAGVHELEDGGFRASAMGAVTAAFRKTKEMFKA